MRKKKRITVTEVICDLCKKNLGHWCSCVSVKMDDGKQFDFCDHRCQKQFETKIYQMP